jgi:hypothetical protein
MSSSSQASGVAFDACVLLTGSVAGKLSFKPLSNASSSFLSCCTLRFESSACLSVGAGSNLSVMLKFFLVNERVKHLAVPPQEQTPRRRFASETEDLMAAARERRIVETPMEARQAEPGPSILVLLLASLGLAAVTLVAVWTIFFHP